jgi:sigma-B regulation protein RsbQ
MATVSRGLVDVMSPTDHLITRNNVTFAGKADGPVVVFAHGFGCDQNMWRRVLPFFADNYRIVLFDHVGAGGSDPAAYDPDKYSALSGYAADLVELCDALDLRDVTLVAHSISSMMAVTAAAQHPDRFRRLVLVAPSPCYIDDPSQGYVGGFSSADIDELLASMDNNYFAWAASIAPMVMGNPESPELGTELAGSFCQTNPATARDFARVTFLSDTRDLLTAVTVPTLVLQCSDDALAPVEVGRYVTDRIAGSHLVQLQATGHCPHVSAPAETAQAILAYLHDPAS